MATYRNKNDDTIFYGGEFKLKVSMDTIERHDMENVNFKCAFSTGNASVELNKVVGVSDGLISIHTYGESAPTITVTSGGNSIETTVHDMSSVTIKTYNKQFVMPTFVTTFEMPDGDVAVSIS